MKYMILSKSLSIAVKKQLGLDFMESDDINSDQLQSITSIAVAKNDISSLSLFPNLISVDLEAFPSVTTDDLMLLAKTIPNLKCLKIKEQSALITIDFAVFTNLEELCLIHNENLENITNIPKLNKLIFYDNKEFVDSDIIVDFVANNLHCNVSLDILYYTDILKYLVNHSECDINLKNIHWFESVGLRKYLVHEYTNDEIDDLVFRVSFIISKYIHNTDSEIEKFGILYKWMLNNISFINEDDQTGNVDLSERVNNIYKVYKNGAGGRLSYAKAFQLLLAAVGIKSSLVYSLGAFDTIGYYNGQKIYSLLGTSDYALLRVTLEDKKYYTDIAWDSMVNDYQYFDELRLFLVSKEELSLRHKFVGEGNIGQTYSYHGDDCDDLIMYATERIKETDKVFNDINHYDTYIEAEKLNNDYLESQIKELIDKVKNQWDVNSTNQDIINALTKLENEKKYSDEIITKYDEQKKNAIQNSSHYIFEHYIAKDDLALSNNDLIDKLKIRLDNQLLSKYIYDVLVLCINQRTI